MGLASIPTDQSDRLLAFVAPLASALTLAAPQNCASEGPCTIKWSALDTDPPSFTLLLVDNAFSRSWNLANEVTTFSGSITVPLPTVTPGYVTILPRI